MNYLEQGTNKELKTSETIKNQTFDSEVPAEAIDIEGYDKVEPSKVTITIGLDNNVINFYYTKRTDLSYTVNYLTKNAKGEEVSIADSKTINNQTFDSTVRVFPEEIEGYLTPLAEEVTIAVEGNEVNFYYTPRTDLSYTVRYMLNDSGTISDIHEPVVRTNQVFNTEQKEGAPHIAGYVASEPTEQIFTIDKKFLNGDQLVTFYYTVNENVTYTVRAINDENGQIISEEVFDSNKRVGDSVVVQSPSPRGYRLAEGQDPSQILTLTDPEEGDVVEFRYVARGDLTYEIQYCDADTSFPIAGIEPTKGAGLTAGQTVEVTLPADIPGYAAEPVRYTLNGQPYELQDAAFTIDDDVVLMVFFAKRTDLTYTVNYRDYDTNELIASELIMVDAGDEAAQNPKTVGNNTMGTRVTEAAPEIEGYNLHSSSEPNISLDITVNEQENVINFYYTKRTDLTYTVNYLEQGTDKELANALTRNNQVFDAEITENAIDIEGYNKVSPDSQTFNIKVDANENIINFYYTKRTDLSYTVNHLEQGTNRILAEADTVIDQTFGNVIEPEKVAKDIRGYQVVDSDVNQAITIGVNDNVLNIYYEPCTDLTYTIRCLLAKGDQEFVIQEQSVEGQVFGNQISVTAPALSGYTLLADQPQSQDITIDVEGNVVEFRYSLRTDLSYTVNYADDYGNTISEPEVVDNQEFGAKVTVKAPTFEGYEIADPEAAEITIEIAEFGNQIIFVYKKIDTLSYTVNYLLEGTNEVLHEQKVAENQEFGATITAADETIDIPGYTFDSADKASITIGAISEENVINLYYAKRTDLEYTVRYLVREGETASPIPGVESKVDTGTLGDQIIVDDEVIAIDGYNFAGSNVIDALTITAEENVLNLYYTKRADLSYIVNHFDADGNVIEDAITVENVTFETEISSKDAAVEVIGYEYDNDRASTLTVGTDVSKNILNVYYKKRADLSYVVNYLELGSTDDAEPLAKQKVVENQEFNTSINVESEIIDIDGYNYDSMSADELVLTSLDEAAVLNVYYTKRTDLSFTVKYLIEGTEDEVQPSETTSGQTFGDSIVVTAPSAIAGYNLVGDASQTITIGTDENTATFFYEPTENLFYTVNYIDYLSSEPLAEPKTVDGKVYGEEVSEAPITIKGYYPESSEPYTYTMGLENNVINIGYAKRTDLSYTVNYLLEGTTDTTLRDAEIYPNQTYLAEVSARAIDIPGYVPVDPVSDSLIIGQREDIEDNTFNFYYRPLSNLSYTVNYLTRDADGTERALVTAKIVHGTDENPVTFGSTVTEDPIDIAGYVKPTSSETVEVELENNVINFYYIPRTDLSYTVNYLEQDVNTVIHEPKVVENQTFGAVINQADEVVDIEGFEPVDSTEDPLTIGVDADSNVINVYYTRVQNLSYTVRYVDAEDESVELYPSVTRDGYAFSASVPVSAEDIDGYLPDAQTKEITIGMSQNEVVFKYSKRNDLSYTVNYIDQTTNAVLETETIENQKFGATISVSDLKKKIPGFLYVDADRENLQIATNVESNEINLYYVRDTALSYTVKYVDADGESIIDNKVVGPEGMEGVTEIRSVAYGEEISETAADIKGYTLTSNREVRRIIDASDNEIIFTYEIRSDLSYTVNYLLQDSDERAVVDAKTVGSKKFGEAVTETAPEIAGYTLVGAGEATIIIGERDSIDDNTINFYYEPRTDLAYTVNYYEKDTNKVLRDPKTVANQRMGDTISAHAEAGEVTFDGYRFDSSDPEQLIIGVDSARNVINLYYAPITDLTYTVNFMLREGDDELPIPGVDSLVVRDQAYGAVVKVEDVAREIPGYRLDSSNVDFVVSLNEGENQFNIYYQRRTDLPYTINYLERGTDAQLAEPTQAYDGVFESVVYPNDEGIAKDIDGYRLSSDGENMVIRAGDEPNVLNVYYTKRTDLSFTVNYIDLNSEDANEEASTPLHAERTFGQVITVEEAAIEIPGYEFAYAQDDAESITIGANPVDNVLNLYYRRSTNHSYTVTFEGVDSYGNPVQVRDEETINATFKDKINLADYAIVDGYRLDGCVFNQVPYDVTDLAAVDITVGAYDNNLHLTYVPRDDLELVVRYIALDADGNEIEIASPALLTNQTFGQSVPISAEQVMGYTPTGDSDRLVPVGATREENTYTFYYTLSEDLTCTVNHLDAETGDAIADATTVEGLSLGSVVDAAGQALQIDGYQFDRAEPETLTISNANNVINLYYIPVATFGYTVNYLEQDTNEVIYEAKNVGNLKLGIEVAENAIDVDGYDKVEPTAASITISAEDENVINFYYTKRTDLTYTVNFLERGTNEVLAEAKTESEQTFGDQIVAADEAVTIDGYNYDSPSVESITIGTGENVLNLYYTKRTDLEYTVNYLEQGTDTVIAETKTVDGQTFKDTATEEAIDVPGYNLVGESQASITIEAQDNVVNFYYTPRTDLSYTVNYLEQDTNDVLATAKVVGEQTFQDEVTEEAIDINGYTKLSPVSTTIRMAVEDNVINFYYTKRTDLTYTVNYRVQGTNELIDSRVERDLTFNETVLEMPTAIEGYNPVDDASIGITIGTGTNVIDFYYTPRTDLSYTVRYLEEGTDSSVADEKVVNNLTFRSELTEQAIDVPGYRAVGDTTRNITVAVENEPIVFYYALQQVTPPADDDDYPYVPAPPVDADTPTGPTTPTAGGNAGAAGAGNVPTTPTVPTAGGDALAPVAGDAAGDTAVAAGTGDATTTTIEDDANPLAAADESTIEDDATPMGAFDSPTCWAHNLMILGILLTLIYGIGVIARRLGYAKKINSFGILR